MQLVERTKISVAFNAKLILNMGLQYTCVMYLYADKMSHTINEITVQYNANDNKRFMEMETTMRFKCRHKSVVALQKV